MSAATAVSIGADQPLRLDHVDLFYSYFGVTFQQAKAESGWLALMPGGTVHFYEGRRPDLSRPPKFAAPDVGSMQYKRFLLHIRFNEVRRVAMFTGRSDPKAEGVDHAGELIEGVGELFDSKLLELAGLAVQGGGLSWESLTNSGGRQRRVAAKEFWRTAVEAGTRPKSARKTTASQSRRTSAPSTRSSTPEEASADVAVVFEAIAAALAAGEEVRLPGFGAFAPVIREGRGSVEFRSYSAFRDAVATGE